jgi:RNase P subunit RPR2
MNETCDRCGPAVRAAYRVDRSGELYLCRHCTNLLWPALSARGWNIRERLVTVSATGVRQIKIP